MECNRIRRRTSPGIRFAPSGLRQPQLRRQADALQLTRGALGNLGEDHDLARYFEIRQTLGGEFAQLFFCERRAFAQHHSGGDFFAEFVVRHGEGDHLRDGGVIHQHFIDFKPRDFFAAAVDAFGVGF
jgi:hypothetical protein